MWVFKGYELDKRRNCSVDKNVVYLIEMYKEVFGRINIILIT